MSQRLSPVTEPQLPEPKAGRNALLGAAVAGLLAFAAALGYYTVPDCPPCPCAVDAAAPASTPSN